MAESDTTTRSAGEARLIPQGSHTGRPPIPITRPATLIGSRKDVVRLHLDSSTVSNVHCVIVLNDWGCYIHDLGSRTHTWVNGQQVTDADLADGDKVQIGRFEFVYQAPARVVGSPTPAPQVELDVSTLSDPLPITKRVVQIGRRRGSDLEFDEDKVSNIHAILFERNGRHYIRDIGSRTGTWLDGKPIHQERVADGAQIRIGSATITLNEIVAEVAPSPAIPLPMPVPPASLVSPQIDKPLELEPIRIDSIPLETGTLDTQAEVAPEVEAEPEPAAEVDLGIELADEPAADTAQLTDDAIAEALSVPAAEVDLGAVSPPAEEQDDQIEVAAESQEQSQVESDEDDLVALRRGWRGASRAETPDEVETPEPPAPAAAPESPAEPEAVEPAVETPVVAEAEVPDQAAAIAPVEVADVETPEPASAAPVVSVEPIDLPLPPAPEPIVVPVDDVTDDDGAIDLPEAPAMPVAGAIAEPELPLESDAAGLDEVAPVVDEQPSEPESDVDLEAVETGEPEADVAAEIGAPEAVADEAEDEFDVVAEAPVVVDEASAPEPLADVSLTEAAESALAEPAPAVADEIAPEPEATHEEIAEAIIEEPLADEAPAAEAGIVAPEIQDKQPDSSTDPLAELDLLDEPAVDLSTAAFDKPESAAGPDDDDTAPAPVADLQGIDFSEISLDDDSSDTTEFEDASADTAFAVSELDPFDLEENETAEPLMNLADSIAGETHDGVEVMEETAPTPASALQEFVDEFVDEDEDNRDQIELLDEPGRDTPGDTAVVEAGAGEDQDSQDVLGGLIAPPPPGDLRDLIPTHGPMLGGAFAPAAQGFMVGGSPLVGGGESKPAAKVDTDEPETPEPRRPHRVGFGAQPAVKSGSPFAADSNRTIADVLIGRRAAASVDVFANPSPTPEDLLLDEKEGGQTEAGTAPNGEPLPVRPLNENDELLKTAERFRPRGAISAMQSFPQVDIPPVYKPEDDPEFLAKLRRRRLRTVLVCTLLLVPLIGGIVMGVYKYFPVESKLVAAITYEGLNNASEHRKREFRSRRIDMLSEDYTRGLAMNELGPAWDNKKGFLASTDAIKAALVPTPTERWPASNPDQMNLIVMSRDKQDDLARLRALALAMVKADEQQVRRAQELRDDAAARQKEVQELRDELERIDKKLEVNRALGENRPDDSKIAEVEDRRKLADQEVTAAIKQRQEIEAAIERLRTLSVEELAPLPTAELESQDDTLKKLHAQVEEIRKQSDSHNAALASRTDDARKVLDAAVSKLEADLTAAKQQEVNGKFGDYVDGAKRLATDVKNMTEDLLRRQEQQYTRLQELKQKLSDRFEQRTRETLEGDLQLKQMKDELSMLQRQQNAAVSEGHQDDAQRVSALMKLLQVKIEEKEYQHKNDPVHQEVIASLESIIQQTARSIAEDRKDINERLTASREDFLRKAPRVDELPEDQKEVAASIEKQFAAVAEARKAYSSAADAAEAEQAKLESQNREQLAKLQADIHGRRIEIAAAAREKQAIVAEQNRKKRLEEKELELAAARQAQESKETVLAGVTAEKEKMEEHRRKLLETERETAELVSLKSEKEQRSKHLSIWLRSKEAELAGIIMPSSKVDVQSFDQEDRRPLYAGVGAGAVFLLMLMPIVHNLRLLSRDSHAPKPASGTSASGNGFDPILNQSTDVPTEEAPSETEPAVTR